MLRVFLSGIFLTLTCWSLNFSTPLIAQEVTQQQLDELADPANTISITRDEDGIVRFNGKLPDSIKVNGVKLDVVEFRMLKYLNDFRATKNLSPLLPSPKLMERCRKHAKWMSQHGMHHRMDNIAENIAAGTHRSRRATDMWIRSPGHNSNMRQQVKNVGLSYCQNAQGQTFWVQCFQNDTSWNYTPESDFSFYPSAESNQLHLIDDQASEVSSGNFVSYITAPTAGIHPVIIEKPKTPQQLPLNAPVAIAPENQYANAGGYCTWACLDALARHHGITALRGITRQRWEESGHALTSPGYDTEVKKELEARGVRYQMTKMEEDKSKHDLSLLTKYGNTLGVEIALRPNSELGLHSVLVVGFGEKELKFYDTNRKARGQADVLLTRDRQWFDSYWYGRSVVVFPDGYEEDQQDGKLSQQKEGKDESQPYAHATAVRADSGTGSSGGSAHGPGT